MRLAYGTRFCVSPTGRFLAVNGLAAAANAEREKAVKCYGAAVLIHGVLWRVEAATYTYRPDPYADDWASTDPRLELHALPVLRWTPAGARLDSGRWVDLRPDRKQWASRTPEGALAAFVIRRRGQIHILERQLARARQELALARFDEGLQPIMAAPENYRKD